MAAEQPNRTSVLAVPSALTRWPAWLLVKIRVLDQLSPFPRTSFRPPYLQRPGSQPHTEPRCPVSSSPWCSTLFELFFSSLILFSEPLLPLRCKLQKSRDPVRLVHRCTCDTWLRAGAQGSTQHTHTHAHTSTPSCSYLRHLNTTWQECAWPKKAQEQPGSSSQGLSGSDRDTRGVHGSSQPAPLQNSLLGADWGGGPPEENT